MGFLERVVIVRSNIYGSNGNQILGCTFGNEKKQNVNQRCSSKSSFKERINSVLEDFSVSSLELFKLVSGEHWKLYPGGKGVGLGYRHNTLQKVSLRFSLLTSWGLEQIHQRSDYRGNGFQRQSEVPESLCFTQDIQNHWFTFPWLSIMRWDDLYLETFGMCGQSDCLHDCKLVFSFHVSNFLLFLSQGRWKIAVDYSWYKPPYALQ